MSRPVLRRVGTLAASITLLLVVSAAPGQPARVFAAAGDGIDVRTASTYTLLPDAGVVRVVVDLSATNTTPPETSGGVTRRFYFTAVHLALQPEATHVQASADGHRLATTLVNGKGYGELAVSLPARLAYRQTVDVRVAFDLPGGAPRSEGDIRVGQAFASFYAWVNGDLASIRIVLPTAYTAKLSGATLAEHRAGATTTYTADRITETTHWYVVVDADRPGSLLPRQLRIPTGEAVEIRGWPEDRPWLDRVGDRLEHGLPELDKLVGLPWPVDGQLVVTEVHTPLLEGYAGLYHPESKGIEISEDLDDLTILHEASHAWFNGGLFDGRWIDEGLADTYATMALGRIGIFSAPPFEYLRTDRAAFPLNDWAGIGRIDDAATQRREDYGYQTSFKVIQVLTTLAGQDGMRRVFAAAASREIAYVGAPPAETRDAVPTWRALLDYLDERAGVHAAQDQFRLWVVGARDLNALTARTAARAEYAGLLTEGAGWLPPYAIRSPMAGWDFRTASQAMKQGEAILAVRQQIAAAGAPADLPVPDGLRTAYEGARSDLAAVLSGADADLAAARSIVAARDRLAGPRDLLASVGLIGVDPSAAVEAATVAYRAGRAGEARADVDAALGVLDRAPEAGVRTIVGIVGGGGAGIVVLALIVRGRRRSRQRALARAAAGLATASRTGWDWPTDPSTPPPGPLWGPGLTPPPVGPPVDPAGTLASQPSPDGPGADRGAELTVIEPSATPPDASAG